MLPPPRPSLASIVWTALVVVGLALLVGGLLLPELGDAQPSPPARRAPEEPGLAASARAEAEGGGLSAPSPAPVHRFALPVAPSRQEASAAPPSHPGGWASPSSATSLPAALPSRELGPDGLPVTALRCTVDGGVLACGACRLDEDCPPGEGCVPNYSSRANECAPSLCQEDGDCPPAMVCHRVSRPAFREVRQCVPAGPREEEESCAGDYATQAGSCRRGLVCLGDVCRARCTEDACPPGHACEEAVDGRGCVPDCTLLGCPGGQRCVRLPGGGHQCLAAVRGECNERGCAEGERCNMRVHQARAVFWCARLCNPMFSDSCATGQVCGIGSPTVSTCFEDCSANLVGGCPEGWACTAVNEELTQWGCLPSSPSTSLEL